MNPRILLFVSLAFLLSGCASFDTPKAKAIEAELITTASAVCVYESETNDIPFLSALCNVTADVATWLLARRAEARRAAALRRSAELSALPRDEFGTLIFQRKAAR